MRRTNQFWLLFFFLFLFVINLEHILFSITLLLFLRIMLLTHSNLLELIFKICKFPHIFLALWLCWNWSFDFFRWYICRLICVNLCLTCFCFSTSPIYFFNHVLFHRSKHRSHFSVATLFLLTLMVLGWTLQYNGLSVLILIFSFVWFCSPKFCVWALPYSHGLVYFWYILWRVILLISFTFSECLWVTIVVVEGPTN